MPVRDLLRLCLILVVGMVSCASPDRERRESTCALALPTVADPRVGPEFGMDEPVYGPGQAGPAAVASNPNGVSLVVWIVNSKVYGARVAANGTVLDPNGIAIATTGRAALFSQRVASNGTTWLVVWVDSSSNTRIVGARVDAAGTVLDGSSIPLTAASGNPSAPSVASGGSNWLVAWEGARSGTDKDIYGTRVSAAGTVLDPAGILLRVAESDQVKPAVAYDGTNWLVGWGEPSGISVARVAGDGGVLDSNAIAVTTNDSLGIGRMAISHAAGNWLVVWGGGSDDIRAARVSSAGALLDASPIALTNFQQNYPGEPAIATDGTNFLVVWLRTSSPGARLYGSRVSATGTVLSPSQVELVAPVPNGSNGAQVAFDGTNFLVVWSGAYAARVNGGGAVLDPGGFPVANVMNVQSAPAASFDGTNWLVVWTDHRGGFDDDIYGTRVSAERAILDPNGIAITASDAPDSAPDVAGSSAGSLVVWQRPSYAGRGEVLGAAVLPNGTVHENNGGFITGNNDHDFSPAVTAAGDWFHVAWGLSGRNSPASPSGTYESGVYATPQTLTVVGAPAGTLVSPPYAAPFGKTGVSYDGTNVLVVWWDPRGNGDIYGVRRQRNGPLGSPFAIAAGPADQGQPAVSYDGTNYFVVWREDRNGNHDVYGARVRTNGTVIDTNGIAITTAPGDQFLPRVSYDGTTFFVVWEDDRNGRDDIYGARVSPSGNVFETSGLFISGGFQESRPTVAAGANGAFLVAYQNAVGQDLRVKARIVVPGCAPSDTADADGDGVADCADACPSIPGSSGDGCLATGTGGAGGAGGLGGAGAGMGGAGLGGGGMSGAGASSGGAGSGGEGRGGVATAGGAGAGVSGAGGRDGGGAGSGDGGEGGSAGEGDGGESSAGDGGSAGEGAPGGADGTSGGSGTAGVSGAAGNSTAGEGGATGEGGASDGDDAGKGGEDDGGCGCRLRNASGSGHASIALLALACLGALRRRRGTIASV